jgi:hypothetical protein
VDQRADNEQRKKSQEELHERKIEELKKRY